ARLLHAGTDWIIARTQSARPRVEQPTITGRSRLASGQPYKALFACNDCTLFSMNPSRGGPENFCSGPRTSVISRQSRSLDDEPDRLPMQLAVRFDSRRSDIQS